jgi:hypothetical protein
MSMGKILVAIAISGAVYALCNEKTQKKVKRALKGVSNSINDIGEEAAEKADSKIRKEKTQHA